MQFSFQTSNSIHFGEGVLRTIPSLLPKGLKRVLVATGSSPYRYQLALDLLEQNGYEVAIHTQVGEPTVDSISKGVAVARQSQAEMVLAIGGGSVIDAAKAIAAMMSNKGELIDYLEIVGKGEALKFPAAPVMAIPTTAGTGAEVTKNAVIGVPAAGLKVSLRSSSMIPRWAIVDPELTYHLPESIAVQTGMDAFIQNLEAFLSRNANPISDAFAKQGLENAARSLRASIDRPLNRQAKREMCIASLCGGVALANSKLGSVHGFAGPIGGMINAPHGAICASLVLPCFQTNLEAMESRDPSNPSIEKMKEAARLITGNPSAKCTYLIAWLESLTQDLSIQRLGQLGLKREQVPEAAAKATGSSSMKGNPIELRASELEEILYAAV